MRRFFYSGLSIAGLFYLGLYLFGRKLDHWGATQEESASSFPGEELLVGPKIESTLAVDIKAPPSEVWSWISQIGRGRAGFYSYTWLENLLGSGIKNVNRIVPGLQGLREGDKIQLHPKVPPLVVTRLVPYRVMALEGWIFQLIYQNGETRLLSRTYSIPANQKLPGFWNYLFRTRFWRFAHFVMQRRMLMRIKELAEDNYGKRLKIGSESKRMWIAGEFYTPTSSERKL